MEKVISEMLKIEGRGRRGAPTFSAEIRLSALAEFAFATFCGINEDQDWLHSWDYKSEQVPGI